MEFGGAPPRVLGLDDYFMTEVEKEERDPDTGKRVKTKVRSKTCYRFFAIKHACLHGWKCSLNSTVIVYCNKVHCAEH